MMATWWENETILQRVRDWLAATEAELAAYSGQSRSAGAGPSLDEATSDEATLGAGPPSTADSARVPSSVTETLPAVGLLQLMEAFTALRHEIKLQTKSARGLEDAVAQSLRGLDQSIESFRSIEDRAEAARDDAVEPLLTTLIDLDETMERGERAFSSIEEQVTRDLSNHLVQSLELEFSKLSPWRRWWASHWQQQVLEACRRDTSATARKSLQPHREGYVMIRARLHRLLAEQGVRRIACVGRPVDPTRMTVVALVDDSRQRPETVTEEVRPGYVWHDHILRFAEVRAVRPSSDGGTEFDDDSSQ